MDVLTKKNRRIERRKSRKAFFTGIRKQVQIDFLFSSITAFVKCLSTVLASRIFITSDLFLISYKSISGRDTSLFGRLNQVLQQV